MFIFLIDIPNRLHWPITSLLPCQNTSFGGVRRVILTGERTNKLTEKNIKYGIQRLRKALASP